VNRFLPGTGVFLPVKTDFVKQTDNEYSLSVLISSWISSCGVFEISSKIRILLADGCGSCGTAALECGGFDAALIIRRL
jgi:hypothetical protein